MPSPLANMIWYSYIVWSIELRFVDECPSYYRTIQRNLSKHKTRHNYLEVSQLITFIPWWNMRLSLVSQAHIQSDYRIHSGVTKLVTATKIPKNAWSFSWTYLAIGSGTSKNGCAQNKCGGIIVIVIETSIVVYHSNSRLMLLTKSLR